MKVELVQATPNALKMITNIASICYGKEESGHPEKLLKHLYDNGHHSTFEHIYYTFKIEGISRICLGQLTRHRHASYSVRSSRYCDESKREMIKPEKIRNDDIAYREWIDLMSHSKRTYDNMIKRGIKKEDARFILPQALSTDLYMSCNLRELIHLNDMRNTKQAQWEIRNLVQKMVKLVTETSSELEFMFENNEV